MRGEPTIAAATEIRPRRYPEFDAHGMYDAVLRAFLETPVR